MLIWPYQTRTLVLSSPAHTAMKKLRETVNTVEKAKYNPKLVSFIRDEYNFNGWVEDNKFRISKRISHPDNFLPIIEGHIEATSSGSIVFLSFKMFFSALLMLMFWTIISLLLAIFFLFIYHEPIYASIALAVGLIQYTVALLNFNRQVAKSWRTLKEVFV